MKQYLSVVDTSTESEYRCKIIVGDKSTDASVGKIIRTFYEDDCDKAIESLYRMYMSSTPQFVVSRNEYAFDPANIASGLERAFKWLGREVDEWYRRFLKSCETTSSPEAS